jgi:tRNA-specific 2-thiouridylase
MSVLAKPKIYVGMSGGVDSSLTAALLVEQGYDVTGVYMKNWTKDLPGMVCPWAEDVADAKRVAVQLGIDFKIYDFESDYFEHVAKYLIDEYRAGRTPNPDIMCNQEMKFKLFLHTARADGADLIATGHYAYTEHGILKRAYDDNKDQTYFLYRVTHTALQQTLFPLGKYTKQQVREMAKKRNLFTAQKKESMGICFVGKVGIKEFLSQYIETTQGAIIDDETKHIVGEHDGAIYYTIGQRHGLHVGGGLPYYVVGKDMEKNEVYVSRNLDNNHLWRTVLELRDIHWINDKPKERKEYHVRLRHRGPLVACTIQGSSLRLAESQRAIAAGQSAVIYDEDICLGGGIIV